MHLEIPNKVAVTRNSPLKSIALNPTPFFFPLHSKHNNKMPSSTSGAIVEGINIYPIKSCHYTSVQECQVDSMGIQHDRRFMIVYQENNRFVTQRYIINPF